MFAIVVTDFNQDGKSDLAVQTEMSNPSNVKISIASITSNGNFLQTNNCGVSLAPGGSCQVSVTFSPTVIGLQSGAITLIDGTRISPLSIPVSGTGVNGTPDFDISPASGSSTSQTISAGQSATFNLVVTPSEAFTGTVSLSCAITPVVSPALTCGLSHSSLQLIGTGSQSVVVQSQRWGRRLWIVLDLIFRRD